MTPVIRGRGNRGRARGVRRPRLSLFWACIIASAFTLFFQRSLFDFGDAEAAAPTEAAQSTVEDGTGSAQHTADAAHDLNGEDSHSDPAHSGAGGHSDPVAPVLIWLVIILISAKLGGDLFDRMGQPAVLGELIAGVAVGNALFFLGMDFMSVLREGTTLFHVADQMAAGIDPRVAVEAAFPGDSESVARFMAMVHDGSLIGHINISRILDIFSRVGVLLLLFVVGLESNLNEMVRVGATSLMVGIVGVIVPFGLGFGVSYVMLSESTIYVHMFIGATLCATSVGITARVFQDLGKLQTKEAKIILGAAVIDDILGLIILAVCQGVVLAAGLPEGTETTSIGMQILTTVGLSALFLGGAVVVGIKGTPVMIRIVAKMRVPGMKLIYSIVFLFTMSWLADLIGLAAIVGAFAAGLVLEEVHFEDFAGDHHRLEELLEPLATIFVPVFFVIMGLQVKLETFADISILGLAAGITIAAVIGKQVCGLAVRDPLVSKISIGFGMIPRGEVGLIFAAIGKTLTYRGEPVIDSGTFSAVVIMVILTTLFTPPLLKKSLSAHEQKLFSMAKR
jgi:Kef-type K+ transport system membrane component KefB